MIYKSEDIKKLNSIALLEKLYGLSNATMAELVQETHFSQSLVRSILQILKEKNILMIKNVEQSSGGRCPSRYSFNASYFQILSVFFDEGQVYMSIKNIFNEELYHQQLTMFIDDHIDDLMIDIIQKYPVNCIVIGSSGVVQDDCFYNDQGKYMEKHTLALDLKIRTSIPVFIENDVKAMLMGIQKDGQYQDLAYIYMNDTGVGSAYYSQNNIIRGHQAFSGELGLLPYQNKSINQTIASGQSNEVLEDIYANLISVVALTIDPEKIILSGKNLHQLSLSNIKEKVHAILSYKYILDIDISLTPLQDALNGLHYIGVTQLFDLYTNYERRG